jgi:hypothetical protein
MITKFPTSPTAKMPLRHRKASLPHGELGTAAGLCREMVGRHLYFSEPERLLLKGCSLAAFATALTITGGIGMMVSAVTFPVIPTAALLLAATAIAGVFETCSEQAKHERRTNENFLRLADTFAEELSRLHLQAALTSTFHAAGEAHSASGGSGAAAGNERDRKQPFPAAEAPNVLRPQFPDFRSPQ